LDVGAVHFTEIEPAPDLVSYLAASDLVVSGSIDTVDDVRVTSRLPSGAELVSSLTTVVVHKVLAGDAAGPTVRFRVMWVRQPRMAPLLLSGVPAPDVGERGVFFVRKGGLPTAGDYFPLNSASMFVERNGVLVASRPGNGPLGPESPTTIDGLDTAIAERRAEADVLRKQRVDGEKSLEALQVLTEKPRPIFTTTGPKGTWSILVARSNGGFCYGAGYEAAGRTLDACVPDGTVIPGKEILDRRPSDDTDPPIVWGFVGPEVAAVSLDSGAAAPASLKSVEGLAFGRLFVIVGTDVVAMEQARVVVE
jgi:hypothetical protein